MAKSRDEREINTLAYAGYRGYPRKIERPSRRLANRVFLHGRDGQPRNYPADLAAEAPAASGTL